MKYTRKQNSLYSATCGKYASLRAVPDSQRTYSYTFFGSLGLRPGYKYAYMEGMLYCWEFNSKCILKEEYKKWHQDLNLLLST
jgi:hypothetical protein